MCAHGVLAEARRGRKNLWSSSYSCELPGVDMVVGVRSFRRVASTLEVF